MRCQRGESRQRAKRHPRAKRFVDFRKSFDHANLFDAVVVSTCEHTHAFATLPALQLGKHVYCEKPLTHNVWEARVIREAAAGAKVATQMGTQIHAGDNYRRVVELIQSGAIGAVREAHVWVSRAWGWHASEAAAKRAKDIVFVQQRPTDSDPVPAKLNWDLWLGPAPARPFTGSISLAPSGIVGGILATARCRTSAAIGSTFRSGPQVESSAERLKPRPAKQPRNRPGIDAGHVRIRGPGRCHRCG